MKKLLVFIIGMMLFAQQGKAQLLQGTWTEDFDSSSISFSVVPSGSWISDAGYGLPNKKGTVSQSYLGFVPTKTGDTSTLVSQVYDFTLYSYVFLRFSHICKVSPLDIARIEYREYINGVAGSWKVLPAASYLGSAANYKTGTVFNAASYPEWQAGDSTLLPDAMWWREELFDLTNQVSMAQAQFRFVIRHGNVLGSAVSYGWLLDNVEMMAATYQIDPPIVQFIAPLVKDTVYSTGPWEINAEVRTNTNAPIVPPWLKWDTNGVFADSVLMTHVSGNAFWKATIPQYVAGTTVSYSITGRDTNGNEATARSGYVIVMLSSSGNTGYVTCGTGTSTTYQVPMNTFYQNSWSRQLYLANELSLSSSGGIITELAWDYAYSTGFTYNNQMCYFKAVDDVNALPDSYVDPVADGATLVWSGTYVAPAGRVWADVTLTTPFMLPPGKNLLIYWMHANGSYFNTSYIFYATPMSSMTVHRYCDAGGLSWTPSSCANNSTLTIRPNARFYIIGGSNLDHSAAVHSIDMPDTVATSPTAQIPIVATVKNKGIFNLDSVTASYSINGGAVKDTLLKFNPSLPWDFVHQDTIGYYTPSMNGYDAVVVWVSYPNGAYDSSTWDDTLTKMIYGTTDLMLEFVVFPQDTVYDVGPFDIAANIYSISGNTVVNNVFLYVETINGGVSDFDTLPMVQNAVTGLWETSVPQTLFGSDVICELTVMDYLGNPISITDRYYIKLFIGSGTDTNGYVIVGTSTNLTTGGPPFIFLNSYSWSRQIYLASELSANAEGGKITELAWDYAYGIPTTKINQKCYFKAVDDSVVTNTAYVDPVADGATLVWQGTFSNPTGRAWANIQLSNPFFLPPNKNVMLYWVDDAGAAMVSVTPTWYYTPTSANMTVFANGTTVPSTLGGGLTTSRPNARFYIVRTGVSNLNSASLQSIISPQQGVVPNVQIPVTVAVQNEGFNDLLSCDIYWTLNGQLQQTTFPGSPTYTFTNPLPARFTDTVTIGSFVSSSTDKDTVVVWVELPNGQLDAVTKDDTLSNISLACPYGILQGPYVIGASSSADFPNFENALYILKNCGISGKVTFQVEDGVYYESVDLSNIPSTINDTIEIISLNGNAVIETTDFGIRIENVNNIIIKDMKINMVGAVANQGIRLNSGNNIEINGCQVTLDTTVTSGLHHCIYKPTGAASHNVRILDNIFTGGVTSASLYGKSDSELDTAWVFDGNKMLDCYNRGAYMLYMRLLSVSHNTIISLANSASTTWGGFMIQLGSVNIMDGNRIIQRFPSPYPTGIGFHTTNQNVSSNALPTVRQHALVCNNEMIIKKEGAAISYLPAGSSSLQYAYSAIQLHYSGVDVYNNSVFVLNDVSTEYYAMYANPYASTLPQSTQDVRNNIFVSTLGRSIYVNDNAAGGPITLDYNNYYTGGSVLGSFRGTAAGDITAWKAVATMDINSVSLLPSFIAPASNLKLSNSIGLLSPRLPGITNDIEGKSRGTTVTMGCYEMMIPVPLNATLNDITTVNPSAVIGQTDTVKVLLSNSGLSTAINSISLAWSLNNGSPIMLPSYPLSLTPGQSTVLTLGTINYAVANENIKVWITDVNGSGLDAYQGDDTISKTINVASDIVAEFVKNPTDTVYSTGVYEVTAKIQFLTNPPPASIPLYIEYIEHEGSNTTMYDTLHLLPKGNDLWTTEIYNIQYESDVAYSLELIDLFNNHIVLADAYYIKRPDCGDIIPPCSCSGYPILLDFGYVQYGDCFSWQLLDGSGTPVLEGGYNSGTNDEVYGYTQHTHMVTDCQTYTFYLWEHDYCGDNDCEVTIYVNGVQVDYFNYVDIPGGYTYTKQIQVSCSNSPSPAPGISNAGPVADTVFIGLNNFGTGDPSYRTPINMFYHNSWSRQIYLYNEIDTNPKPSDITITGIAWYSNTATAVYNNQTCFVRATADQTIVSAAYVDPLVTPNVTQVWQGTLNITTNNWIGITFNTPFVLPAGMNLEVLWEDRNGAYPGTAHTWALTQQGVNRAVYAQQDGSFPTSAGSLITTRPDIRIATLKQSASSGRFCLDNSVAMDEILSPTEEVLSAMPVPVKVRIRNKGELNLDSCYIDWTLDGNLQNQVLYTHPTGLLPDFTDTMTIGSCPPAASGEYEIIAWVSLPNGEVDSVTWDDTLSTSYTAVPLAEFVAPFVRDTLTNALSFKVHAKIFEGTGALIVQPQPQLHVETFIKGQQVYNHNINMTFQDGIWTAAIPQQYYGSKVYYSLFVSDAVGNSITLMDSVYINLNLAGGSGGGGLEDSVIITPTTSGQHYMAPINTFYNYSWSRQVYTYSEVCPNLDPLGTYITKIAWNYIHTTPLNHTNQTCYMRAVTTSTQTTGYADPLTVGAKQVWTGTYSGTTGWVERTLDTMFYLPAGMNLEIFWDNQHGSYYTTNNPTWAYTTMPANMTVYGQSDGSFATATTITNYTTNRPNVKLGKQSPLEVYPNYDLALISLLAPINDPNEMCELNNSPVQVLAANLGEMDYDFTQNNLILRYEIIDPQQQLLSGSKIINTGVLVPGSTDVFELIPSLPLLAGSYDIKVWLESIMDNIPYDDTVAYVYLSGKIGLPIDVDFSGTELPSQFMSFALEGATKWEVYTPNANDPAQPDWGTGVAQHTSSLSQLTTRDIDLRGAVDPVLDFWYFHDTATSITNNSRMEVWVEYDGVSEMVESVLKRNAVHGWKQYTVDLSNYTSAQCVLIRFETVNMGATTQYLDRIYIHAEQNLALDTILVPGIALCDFNNKSVQVVMHNTSGSRIDFAISNTKINLETRESTGAVNNDVYVLDAGNIEAYSYDTVTLVVRDFSAGTSYAFTAWLTDPVDLQSKDDTTRRTMPISPDIKIEALPNTKAPDNCFTVNVPVTQEVRLTNNGNFDVPDIPIRYEISDGSGNFIESHDDMATGVLAAGTSKTIPFTETYTVPADYYYNVRVTAELACDANQADNHNTIAECVDLNDVQLVDILNPVGDQPDNVGDAVKVKVRIKNWSMYNTYTVGIHAEVLVGGAVVGTPLFETITNVIPSREMDYEFNAVYPVPAANTYTLKVYVDNQDANPANDTLSAIRGTNNGIADISQSGFVLGQNIPNPAGDNTRIEYTLPEDGEVVFTVYSVTGQTLYAEKNDAYSGKNDITFSTMNLADGIYYYSMEYKGERLVKKMTVRK